MTFDVAIRVSEILLGFAFVQQSIEYLRGPDTLFTNDRYLFIARLLLAVLLMVGFQSAWVLLLLVFIGLMMLHRFQGPYNGGADRMSLLILCSLCLVHFAPSLYWQEIAFGYLALQLVLSYFISGWVKVINPDWRSGRALCDVFQFSAYPVSEALRGWSNKPRLLFTLSWGVILFELFFPFSLFSISSLYVALAIAASFHLANACLFGLNRFFWIWLSAYPSILWLQLRIMSIT